MKKLDFFDYRNIRTPNNNPINNNSELLNSSLSNYKYPYKNSLLFKKIQFPKSSFNYWKKNLK